MTRTSRTSRTSAREELRTDTPTPLDQSAINTRSRFAARRAPEDDLRAARELLDRGASESAEDTLRRFIKTQVGASADLLAEARYSLSAALEAQRRHREALDAVLMYEQSAARGSLAFDTATRLRVRIAAAYRGVGDNPKAIALLQAALREVMAEHADADALLGAINAGLASVYRSLSEFRIAHDYAQRAVEHSRRAGDWRDLAGVYLQLGTVEGREGLYEDAYRSLKRVIEIVGGETAPHLLGLTYSTLAGVCWYLKRPHESIGHSEKAIGCYESVGRTSDLAACYNNLGISLTLVGDWARAEAVLNQSLALAGEMEGRMRQTVISMAHDSLGDLAMLRGDLTIARRHLDEAHRVATEGNSQWYVLQTIQSSSRCHLRTNDAERAADEARRALDIALHIGDRQAACSARLLLAEAHLQTGAGDECRRELGEVEREVTASIADLVIGGEVQRLRGMLTAQEQDYTLAAHHFARYLAICEMASDRYHAAEAHAGLGRAYADADRTHRAAHHLALAAHAFRSLAAKADLPGVEQRLRALDLTRPDSPPDPATTAHLLTLRLTQAAASRELLLRELATICYTETHADSVFVVEGGDDEVGHLLAAHGATNVGSERLARQLWQSWSEGGVESFAGRVDMNVIALLPKDAAPCDAALLCVAPVGRVVREEGGLLDTLVRVAELCLETYSLRRQARPAHGATEPQAISTASVMPGFIHTSPAMTRLVTEVHKIRSSNVTVLVTGESGTGKELVARLVHTLSDRRDKTFVPFNCTAVPKELSEAYLFGYKRGAFTGATADSPGVIRAAEGGTLFLDEVGDLPLDVQPKLLRFLQEGEVQPLGEQRPVKTDVRIVAATNGDLERFVAEGRFREDLYYRLNVIRLLVPPLRERRTEIPAIVNHYVEHYGAKFGRRDLRISEQAMELLTIGDWAGNVRQLCNEVQRLVVRAEDNTLITPEHLSPELRRLSHAPPAADAYAAPAQQATVIPINSGASFMRHKTLAAAVGDLEQRIISDAMRRHDNNISRVARELGLTRRGLQMKLNRYDLSTTG